jgi:D-amino peptidase
MKVYMSTDLEGVAGVEVFTTQSYPTGKYFEESKHLLTAEVNAAVEGMVEAGVEDILVSDGHGPGAIHFEDLKPPAKLLHGRPCAPRAVLDPIKRTFDVAMIVGQHAMAGVATGTLNHTQSSKAIDYIKLNGKPIGEIAQTALYMGAFGIPLIFLTGDEAACKEAEEFVPGITTVAVKQGVARNAAITLTAIESRRRIKEGSRKAVYRHRESPVAPLEWEGPYVLEKRFFHTDAADAASGQSDAERVDGQTVRFRGESIQDIVYR